LTKTTENPEEFINILPGYNPFAQASDRIFGQKYFVSLLIFGKHACPTS